MERAKGSGLTLFDNQQSIFDNASAPKLLWLALPVTPALASTPVQRYDFAC